jgi:hypothetical protein
MPPPKSVKRRTSAQMGREVVHSYVVVAVKGGFADEGAGWRGGGQSCGNWWLVLHSGGLFLAIIHFALRLIFDSLGVAIDTRLVGFR